MTMYESKNEALLPTWHFMLRMFKHLGLAMAIVSVTLLVGVLGHLWLEPIHWHDAILNISLILAGIGPFIMPASVAGRCSSRYTAYSWGWYLSRR